MIRKIILISFFSWAFFLNAQNRYVATTSMGGDDTNAGTITSPFATCLLYTSDAADDW